jgi:membrane-associated protein
MDFSTVHILDLLKSYGYWILFPLVVVEGPVTTVIAGFLSSTGYMLFVPAYLIIVVADLTGDVLYYSAGRYLLMNSGVVKFLSFLGVDVKKINKAEEVMKRNRGKILFFGKLSHAIGGPILVAAGALKVSIKDFLWFNFWATLPKSLVFLLVGYFFGHAIGNINKYLGITTMLLFMGTGLVVLIYWFIVKKAKKIINNI